MSIRSGLVIVLFIGGMMVSMIMTACGTSDGGVISYAILIGAMMVSLSIEKD